MHRRIDEPEFDAHYELVDGCITMLQQYNSSVLAQRGVRLLHSLLRMCISRSPSSSFSGYDASRILRHAYQGSLDGDGMRLPPGSGFELVSDQASHESPLAHISHGISDLHYDFDIFAELFPPQAGFSNAFLFEDLLGFDLVGSADVVH